MAKSRRGRHEAGVELTPLIDVVFLLLIFFMVSTTFVDEKQVDIVLPEASGEPKEVEVGTIEIIVDRLGDYAVNNRVLVNSEKVTLVKALQESMDASNPSNRVVIRADANATHQAVVRAMDAAGTVGLTQVSITTQEPTSES